MNKHTPGPWKFYKGKLRPKFSQVMIIEIRDKTGKSIVKWTGFDGVNLPKKEIEANARLMAAAPELLEALKTLITALDNCPGEFNYPAKIEDMARAVIAKAKGEQP